MGGDSIVYNHHLNRILILVGLSSLWLCLLVMPLSAANANSQVQITFNDASFLPQYPLHSNSEGRTMIAVSDAARLLDCQLDWVDSNQIQLSRSHSSVSMRIGIPEAIYNNQIIVSSPPPLTIDNTLYIPLRSAAELFGFAVVYDAVSQTAKIYSPDLPVPAPHPELLPEKAPDNLPLWGSCRTAPGLENCWPGEKTISSYYTTLIDRSASRTKNVELSCQAVNGSIVQPGQVFSFNQTSGPRTKERGYEIAPIFVGKKVVPGRGGGVCQTSSTLYNSALEAGLEIVERHPHSLPVAYVAAQRDATVSWGGADLKFRNNLDVPIKILARVWDKYVLCAIAEVN
jgi:hypothetical protein